MEQKKLSYIFEEEFIKWTSLKVFWICLAVMVAGFLALCTTVFYLDNGSAAEVLSGKEQLMANVWVRVFAVISVMPVVIILFMFGFAALMGGLSVIAEKKKRKQAAILGAPQIQKQSKDSEFAAQEQPALVEPEESKAAEQEQMVPVAQAEESPAQPEPTDQEPKEEPAEAADAEEITESEDTEEETKRPYVRGEDHGKASKVTIDHDRFRSVFKLIFMKRNADTDSCSYDTLVKTLENNTWTKSDLARVALLIHESDVLTGNRKYFNKWLIEFFEIMGRNDLPKTKTVSEFHDLSESSIKFRQEFNDLVYTYYEKTKKSTLKFD